MAFHAWTCSACSYLENNGAAAIPLGAVAASLAVVAIAAVPIKEMIGSTTNVHPLGLIVQ
jgi:hypothetical protein